MEQALFQLLILHRKENFHTAVEIPGHPVRTSHEQLLVSAVLKEEDTAVLKEITDNRADRDIFAQPRNTCFQTADSPDNHINLYARTGGLVKIGDDFFVAEGIHLGHDVGLASGQSVFRLPADHAQAARPQPQRRH